MTKRFASAVVVAVLMAFPSAATAELINQDHGINDPGFAKKIVCSVHQHSATAGAILSKLFLGGERCE